MFKLKMSYKVAETTHAIKNALGPGSANTNIVQGCFRKVCKNETLNLRSAESRQWKLTRTSKSNHTS